MPDHIQNPGTLVLTDFLELKAGIASEAVLEYVVHTDQRSVSEIRRQIDSDLQPYGFQYRSLYTVSLDEVLTNIAEHGHGFSPDATVFIRIYIHHPHLITTLADSAKPFDPKGKRAKSPRRQFDKGADGGFGMYMYKRAFYEIEYASHDAGNVTILYFRDDRLRL